MKNSRQEALRQSTSPIFLTTEAEYETALAQVEVFFDMPDEPEPESAEGKEFTALINAIEAYEAIHYPIEPSFSHGS